MGAVTEKDNRWIVRNKPKPDAKIRLFCFPHAGGSAAMFFAWSGLLPETIEVIGLQLPGRRQRVREVPFTRMGPLIKAAAEAVTPFLDRPYAIFGQSVGALMGFELGRALDHRGIPPAHLFVSACSAPHLHAPDPIHALPEPEFIAAIQHFNGTPKEILAHEELMRQLLPTLRADLAVSETYHYEEGLLPCPITAFGGREDQIVPAENIAGWGLHTKADFTQVMFPGGHFYLQASQDALVRRVALELPQI